MPLPILAIDGFDEPPVATLRGKGAEPLEIPPELRPDGGTIPGPVGIGGSSNLLQMSGRL
jgi:hypothetical protein